VGISASVRTAAVGLLACALVGAGVGIAAARPVPGAVAAPGVTVRAGGDPDDLFDYTRRHLSPIPAKRGTARLVWSTTGPAAPPGQVMQLWIADGELGGHCYALTLPDQPPAHRQIDGECSSAAAEVHEIPLGHDYEMGPDGGAVIIFAPGAAHLTLTDAAGTRVLPAVAGRSAAWLPPTDADATLILTSYDATGGVLTTTTEPPAIPPKAPSATLSRP
jgi:hypothetical protein